MSWAYRGSDKASPTGGRSCHMLVPFLMRYLSYFQLPGTRSLCSYYWHKRFGLLVGHHCRHLHPRYPFYPSSFSFPCLSLVYGWFHGILSRLCRFIFRSPRSNKEASLLLVGHCLSETSAQSVLLMSFPSSYCLLSIIIINGLLFPPFPPLLYPWPQHNKRFFPPPVHFPMPLAVRYQYQEYTSSPPFVYHQHEYQASFELYCWYLRPFTVLTSSENAEDSRIW